MVTDIRDEANIQPPAKRTPGRPSTGQALSRASIQRQYRERNKSNVTKDAVEALEENMALRAQVKAQVEFELGEKARARVRELERLLAASQQSGTKKGPPEARYELQGQSAIDGEWFRMGSEWTYTSKSAAMATVKLMSEGRNGALYRCRVRCLRKMLEPVCTSGRGLELADSITADAHKWLNVPYDCGIAFTRHVTLHERAFSADAPYMPLEGQLPAYMNRGVEQSRRYRALSLWMTLMAYGKAGYRELIERHCGYAQRIASWVDESSCFKLLCEVRSNLLVFRYFKEGCSPNTLAELNRQVLSNLNSSGELYITPTTYKGEYALRLSISNWMTQEEDINRVTAALQRAAD